MCDASFSLGCFDPPCVGFGLSSNVASVAECVGEGAAELGNLVHQPALWAADVSPGWLGELVVVTLGWVVRNAGENCDNDAGVYELPWWSAWWPGSEEVDGGLACFVHFSIPDHAADFVQESRPACPQRLVQDARVVSTTGESSPCLDGECGDAFAVSVDVVVGGSELGERRGRSGSRSGVALEGTCGFR